MQNTEIIRAFMLEKGDQFIMLGHTYGVYSNDGKEIICGKYYEDSQELKRNITLGANSRERVELITNHKKNQNGN